MLPHASKVLFLDDFCDNFFCLFVTQISQERLNWFAPNSQWGSVWSLSRTSLNVKVKGHRSRSQGQKMHLALPTPPGAYKWYALAANSVQQQQMGPFRGCQGVFSGACVQCMFIETPLALVYYHFTSWYETDICHEQRNVKSSKQQSTTHQWSLNVCRNAERPSIINSITTVKTANGAKITNAKTPEK